MSPPNADVRDLLERERAHLLARIDELTVGGEVDLDFDHDFADRGQVAGEKGENRSLADTLQAELDRIHGALTRMDDGTYGACAVCGDPIGDERLAARPVTDRCIIHAR